MLKVIFISSSLLFLFLLNGRFVNSKGSRLVLLDRYFNSEKRKDSTGKLQYWHYTWEETTDPGFSIFGDIFKEHGARLASLDVAPTRENLAKASIYIIVDPDNLKDNPSPNYISPENVLSITEWVRGGGVLLLLGNDSANCDLRHLNDLARPFDITFTDRKAKAVINDDFNMGKIAVADNLLFQSRNLFLKDISPLETSDPKGGVLWDNKDMVMAINAYGKGIVVAVGDPWLYNEYIDHRRLPKEFDNFGAANDLVTYLLAIPAKIKTK